MTLNEVESIDKTDAIVEGDDGVTTTYPGVDPYEWTTSVTSVHATNG